MIGSFVVVLWCLLWCQNFGDVSPYICSYVFSFGFSCLVATFLEMAALSVGHMFSLYFDYL